MAGDPLTDKSGHCRQITQQAYNLGTPKIAESGAARDRDKR